VFAWGSNFSGQLGNGTFSTFYSFVQPVPGLTGVVAIASGGAHNLALKAGGTLWSWGGNASGQLDTAPARTTPRRHRLGA